MTDLHRLTAIERDHFAEIVEASLRVTERRHYFSWMQGIVQTLVPHEILICGADDGTSESIRLTYMSGSRYFRAEHFQSACLDQKGVVARLAAEWQATGEARVVAREMGMNGHAEVVEQLEQAELRNIVLHAVRGPGRRLLGVYAFSRIPADCLSPRLAYLLDVLVPYIHGTYSRVVANEARSNGSGSKAAGRQITPREAEILRWIKEGKTNADIAGILQLSPWTVKNHVQTILKKLQAQTRSHAVARAMSMGILDSTSSS